MWESVRAKKVIRQALDVGIVYRQVVGALLDDGHKPRLIRQPSWKIDADIRHLARGPDVTGVTRTLIGTLRLPGTWRFLGTRQAFRSAHIRFTRSPDSREIGLAIGHPRRGGRHVHLAVGLSWHSRGGICHPLSAQMSRC